MKQSAALDPRALLFLFVFALIALAPGIASLPPTDRDESRYAVSATQMLDSGDFVDIRFQDEPRYLQPAGIYWLQAGAAALFTDPGERAIGAYRVPSLIGAALAVVLTGAIGALLFGRAAGVAAGVLLAVCASLAFEARIAKTDAALLAAITAAQFALLRIYLEPSGPRWRPALFWIALGVGMMIKGPIILLFCGSTILALAIWDRGAPWLRGLRWVWGLPLLLAIVAPWYLAIGVESDWQFYARSVGRNLLGKVGESQQSHAGPPGYYLAVFVLTFWPASLFAALAIPFVWRQRAEPSVRFLVAWIVPGWIVYELVATKLPHYVLPTYPAIACLAAAALFAPQQQSTTWWARVLAYVYGALWVLASALVAALGPAALWLMDREAPLAPALLGALVLVAALAAALLTAQRRPARAVAAAAIAGLVMSVNTFALALPRLEVFQLSTRIAEAARHAAPCPRPLLASTRYREPSLVFLHGPQETRFVDTPADAADLLDSSPCALALIDAQDREAFLARAGALGLDVRGAGAVAGRNYSDGEELDLTLYAAAPPP